MSKRWLIALLLLLPSAPLLVHSPNSSRATAQGARPGWWPVNFPSGQAIQGVPATPPPDEEVDVLQSEFDGLSNGFTDADQFTADKAEFEDVQSVEKGLGPVFNSDSCVACHHNPITGGASVITELRAGRLEAGVFKEHPGGSLIHARALSPEIQERVFAGNDLTGLRIAPSVLGLGFVECVSNETLTAIRDAQPESQKGEAILVPVLESRDTSRVGRFGHKCQHGSLLSFSADAYLNEMGITSPLLPKENNSNGRDVSAFDKSPDPEDTGGTQGFGNDVEAFARFMRATKGPPVDVRVAALEDAAEGLRVVRSIGCTVCHVEEFKTVTEGTKLNGATFVVPKALGSKTFRPFSDFLLHDIGTGDGVVQAGGQSTAQKFRTAPLWGLRTKSRLGHDGRWLTRHQAILGHRGQADLASGRYQRLSAAQQRQVQVFLRSL